MARVALLIAAAALLVAPAAAYNNGVGRLPAMGWNTWCTDDLCGLVDLCFEGEVKSVADAMVAQGLDKLGYQYINLDDCWADVSRDANGNIQPNPTQFPSGMKALADYVHSLGLKLGLYTDVGTETCKWKRPGAYGHYEQDAKTLAGWGIDFVKADNCHRAGVDSEMYANYSAALNATGRPILFSLCNWGIEDVETWGPQVGQQYRFQMDHLPLWEWPPLAEGVGFGQGTKNIIEFMATLPSATASGPYGYMDPDFAETMMPLTLPFTESRTEWSFWCLWSSPLLVATDIRNLTAQPEKASIITNREPIAIDQDEWGIAGRRQPLRWRAAVDQTAVQRRPRGHPLQQRRPRHGQRQQHVGAVGVRGQRAGEGARRVGPPGPGHVHGRLQRGRQAARRRVRARHGRRHCRHRRRGCGRGRGRRGGCECGRARVAAAGPEEAVVKPTHARASPLRTLSPTHRHSTRTHATIRGASNCFTARLLFV